MSQPLIGISTYLEEARWGVWTLPAALLPAGYHRLVQRAGGAGGPAAAGRAPATAAAAVARLDGLVVAGGPDVEPGPLRGRAATPGPGRPRWSATPGSWR